VELQVAVEEEPTPAGLAVTTTRWYALVSL
jgi:hypothetical protein